LFLIYKKKSPCQGKREIVVGNFSKFWVTTGGKRRGLVSLIIQVGAYAAYHFVSDIGSFRTLPWKTGRSETTLEKENEIPEIKIILD